MFDQIVGYANDVVMVAEIFPGQRRYRITYVNHAFTRLFGYAESEIIGQSPRILNGPATSELTVTEISEAIHNGEQVRRRILNYTKNGQGVWIEANIVPLANASGEFTHFAAIERDVTEQVRREEELTILATTDSLTRLINRRTFDRLLQQEIARVVEFGVVLSLATIDLDHFKKINDQYGHGSGDEVLVIFANLLRASFDSSGYIARVGGEEFSVLMPDTALQTAQCALDQFRKQIKREYLVLKDGTTVEINCSVGLTDFRPYNDSASSFCKRADAALYEAKRNGRDQIIVVGSQNDAGSLQVA